MNTRKPISQRISIVVNHNTDDMESQGRSANDASVSATKASSTQSVLNDLDEMESMLSLTQTISFDEDDNQNKDYSSPVSSTFYYNKDDDATYNTDDDDSYSSNSLESVSTRRSNRRGRKYKQRALVACGEGIEDASDKFFESIVDTGRVISSIINKRGPTLRKLSNTFFMSEEERVVAKKEAIKRLEEERRVKREAQMKEELKQAYDEVGMSMANLWREDKKFAC